MSAACLRCHWEAASARRRARNAEPYVSVGRVSLRRFDREADRKSRHNHRFLDVPPQRIGHRNLLRFTIQQKTLSTFSLEHAARRKACFNIKDVTDSRNYPPHPVEVKPRSNAPPPGWSKSAPNPRPRLTEGRAFAVTRGILGRSSLSISISAVPRPRRNS